MKISVITINFNNKAGLIKTVESVLGQSYQDIEFIVIDGGSTDGGEQYIEENSSHFAYWISEPDGGIYNAMNKGIAHATGDYLLFLNSGDWLYSNDIFEKVVALKPTEDIVYGNANFVYSDGSELLNIMPDKLDWQSAIKRIINHQSTFFHSQLFNNGKRYDESYKFLADYAFYNNAVLFNNRSYRHVNLTITNYDAHGVSGNPAFSKAVENEKMRFLIDNAGFFILHLKDENFKIQKKIDHLLKNKMIRFSLSFTNILNVISRPFRGIRN